MNISDKKFYDFSNCKIDKDTVYTGSDRKKGILFNNDRYMVKYQAKHHSDNVFSEYISSHIIKTLNIPVHDTLLGKINDEYVVACKNFLNEGEILQDFAMFLRRSYDSSEIGRVPQYNQIIDVINNEEVLITIKEDALKAYWETFVVDALIGNFDRHKGNWSYIRIPKEDKIICSPIYDCGSSLYPELAEDGMKMVLSSEEEVLKRIYTFPRAALQVDNKNKVSYYDMLSSGFDEYCSQALLKIAPLIDINKINNVIDNTPEIDNLRKVFYKVMIRARKELIIDRAYNRINSHNYNIEAQNRLLNGLSKDDRTNAHINEMKELINNGWNYLHLFTTDDIEVLKGYDVTL